MKKLRVLALFLAIWMVVGLLAGCGKQEAAPESTPAAPEKSETPAPSATPSDKSSEGGSEDKTVIIAMESEPETLDSSTSGLDIVRFCTDPVFGRIVDLDATGTEIVPAVAESWTYITDKQIEFKIRTDVLFHNGRKLTADDVAYSLQFQIDELNGGVQYSNLAPYVESIEAKDDTTVLLTLKDPFAAILTIIQKVPIICKEAIESNATAPVSCGPFKFVSWDKNQSLKLEAFDDYYRSDIPTYRNLQYNFYADTNACLTAFLAGDVDVINWMSNIDIPTVEAQPDAYVQGATASQFYIHADMDHEILSKPGVMQAINLALDRDQIVDLVLDGYGEAIYIPMTHESPYYPDDIDFACDREKAKQLLAEAGYPDGFTIGLLAPKTAVEGLFAEVVQAQLSTIGINVELNVPEVAAFLEEWAAGNFDLAICGHGCQVDPAVNLNRWMTNDTRNYGGYSNPELDELAAVAAVTVDEDARKQMYYDAYHSLVDNPGIIYCIADMRFISAKDNISNVIQRYCYNDYTELIVK